MIIDGQGWLNTWVCTACLPINCARKGMFALAIASSLLGVRGRVVAQLRGSVGDFSMDNIFAVNLHKEKK